MSDKAMKKIRDAIAANKVAAMQDHNWRNRAYVGHGTGSQDNYRSMTTGPDPMMSRNDPADRDGLTGEQRDKLTKKKRMYRW